MSTRKKKDIKPLLNKRERALVGESDRYSSTGRLREKVKLFRKLRDKYRDLARRQKIDQRGKVTSTFDGGEKGTRTQEKAEYFARRLDGFRKRVREAELPFIAKRSAEDEVPSTEKDENSSSLAHFHNPGLSPEAIQETAELGTEPVPPEEKADGERVA